MAISDYFFKFTKKIKPMNYSDVNIVADGQRNLKNDPELVKQLRSEIWNKYKENARVNGTVWNRWLWRIQAHLEFRKQIGKTASRRNLY
jgi:hypothetical protein